MGATARAAAGVGALTVGLNLVGLALRPGFLASPAGEVYGHAFVQGTAADVWPALPTVAARLWPAAPWVVIDPLPTWLAAGLSRVVGPVAAYDAVALAGLALAAVGGARLAAVTGGDPRVGALALAWAPCFLGSVSSGLTEDLGLGLVALALAELVRLEGPDRRALAAGALLAAVAASGLYLAVIAGVAAAVIALARLRAEGRRLLGGFALAAAIGLVAAALVAWPHRDRLAGHGHHQGTPPERVEARWRQNPVGGDDLASFVAPGRDAVVPGELQRVHPGYLGLSVLVLAGLGMRGSRRWGVLAVAGVTLAAGPRLRALGHPLGVPNPVVAALKLGPLSSLNHWGRLLPIAALGLLVPAARGARRRPAVAAAAVAADLALASPVSPWLPTADASVPPIWTSIAGLAPGAVVVVPSAGPGVAFQTPLWHALAQDRPVSLHPSRPGYGAAEEIPLTRWFAGLPGERKDPPDPAVSSSLVELRRRGIGVIVVRDPYVADVTALLGPPAVTVGSDAAWAVP